MANSSKKKPSEPISFPPHPSSLIFEILSRVEGDVSPDEDEGGPSQNQYTQSFVTEEIEFMTDSGEDEEEELAEPSNPRDSERAFAM